MNKNIGILRRLLLALLWAVAFAAAPAVAQQIEPTEPADITVIGIRPYTVNPGDEIEVYVWGEERLQRVLRVLPDGTFTFPLVGQVQAEGQLPSSIAQAIKTALASQYRGEVPQVTVSVANPAGLNFSIIGRVRSPGTFTPGRYVNVLEALSLAGGPDEFANLDNVSIVRKTPQGLQTFQIRLAGALKRGPDARELEAISRLRIESGDTVIVP